MRCAASAVSQIRTRGAKVYGRGAIHLDPKAIEASKGVYEKVLAEERAANEAARKAHPWMYGSGQVAGGAASTALLSPGTAAVGVAPWATRILVGGLEGAAQGAIRGAGEADDGDRLSGAAWGAPVGAIGGGVRGYLRPQVDALKQQTGNALMPYVNKFKFW